MGFLHSRLTTFPREASSCSSLGRYFGAALSEGWLVLHNLVTLQMLAEELHYLVVHSHMEGPAIEPFGVRANRSGLQKTAWREEGCMACARDRVELDPRPKRFLN